MQFVREKEPSEERATFNAPPSILSSLTHEVMVVLWKEREERGVEEGRMDAKCLALIGHIMSCPLHCQVEMVRRKLDDLSLKFRTSQDKRHRYENNCPNDSSRKAQGKEASQGNHTRPCAQFNALLSLNKAP